jgi:hypothetical protein
MSSSFSHVGVMKYKIPAKEPCCSSPVTNKINRITYGKVAAKYTTCNNNNNNNNKLLYTTEKQKVICITQRDFLEKFIVAQLDNNIHCEPLVSWTLSIVFNVNKI